MLIIFKGKVELISEELMELGNTKDSMGINNFKDGSRWVWRKVAIPYQDIYRVVQYSKDKSLIYLYVDEGSEKLLVAESFETVISKWQEMREKYGAPIFPEEEEEQSDTEDLDDKDEDS